MCSRHSLARVCMPLIAGSRGVVKLCSSDTETPIFSLLAAYVKVWYGLVFRHIDMERAWNRLRHLSKMTENCGQKSTPISYEGRGLLV